MSRHHVTLFHLSECAVKRPSSPWLRPIRQDGATDFALIGLSHIFFNVMIIFIHQIHGRKHSKNNN